MISLCNGALDHINMLKLRTISIRLLLLNYYLNLVLFHTFNFLVLTLGRGKQSLLRNTVGLKLVDDR